MQECWRVMPKCTQNKMTRKEKVSSIENECACSTSRPWLDFMFWSEIKRWWTHLHKASVTDCHKSSANQLFSWQNWRKKVVSTTHGVNLLHPVKCFHHFILIIRKRNILMISGFRKETSCYDSIHIFLCTFWNIT